MSVTATDLVIVGAGAAGLAAARSARERGIETILLEASARIGGRAWTETETFGIPWDRGCHWLHSAEVNPMRDLADQYGFDYRRDPSDWRLIDQGAVLDASANDEIEREIEAIYAAAGRSAHNGDDRPVSRFIGAGSLASKIFTLSIQAEWGFDPDGISAVDISGYRDTGKDWPVKDGYGALVAHHHRNTAVELATPVTRIEWGGPSIRVTTPAGTIESKRVLVTVSTGILGAGKIELDPVLPDWKLAAIEAVPLGCDNKAAVLVRGGVPGVEGPFSAAVPFGEGYISAQVHPFGTELVSTFIGGSIARELEGVDDREAIGAVVDALAAAFGSALKTRIGASTITAWGRDPLVLGAYGAARPGLAHLRKDLGVPIEDRLYFAGEATSPEFYSTCHGAHMSGIAAIDAISSSLVKAKN